MNEYRGVTAEHFLTSEEIEKILAFARATNAWERHQPGSFWDNRVLSAQQIRSTYSEEVGVLLYDIRNRMAEKIKEHYHVPRIYADVVVLARWFPGQEQAPHADDMRNVDGHEDFHHREFGSVLYLNEDYLGGHTYYPDYSIEVTPKAGMLAIHPASPDHLHGVTKVEDGMRYTIASFWTTHENYSDLWRLE